MIADVKLFTIQTQTSDAKLHTILKPVQQADPSIGASAGLQHRMRASHDRHADNDRPDARRRGSISP